MQEISLNKVKEALSRIEKDPIIQGRSDFENSFICFDGNPEYNSYLHRVLKVSIFLLQNRSVLIQKIFSKDITPDDSEAYLLISRYFTSINNHLKSFILVDLINSKIRDPLLYEYTEDLEHSAESIFTQNREWSLVLRDTQNVLSSLRKYLIDESAEMGFTIQQESDFSIMLKFVTECGLIMRDRDVPPKESHVLDDFPTDRKQFYITKKDGKYFYEKSLLRHNDSKAQYSRILIITLNAIGSRTRMDYTELLPLIRKQIQKLRNKDEPQLRSIVQKALTSRVHGVNRCSKKQSPLLTNDNNPIFEIITDTGLSFFNKI